LEVCAEKKEKECRKKTNGEKDTDASRERHRRKSMWEFGILISKERGQTVNRLKGLRQEW